MSFGVEYILGLIDRFSGPADNAARAASNLDRKLGGLGDRAAAIDGKIANSAEAINKLASSHERAGRVVADYTNLHTRAARDRARAQELEFQSLGRIEKLQMSMLERQTARQQLIASGQLKERSGRRGEGAGVGFMGGLFAMSMLNSDVYEKNLDFEEKVRLTRGILYNASDADISRLSNSAVDMSRGSVFKAADVMEAFKDLAGRGVDFKDMPKMVRQVMGLATGSGEDLTKTMDAHLAILRQFNLGIDKIPHISDTLAAVQLKTGATLSDQESFFRYAGPSASIFGVPMEDLAAMEGTLALKGIKGSLAGTGIRRMLTGYLKWNKQNSEVWGQLGIKKSDIVDPQSGQMRSIFDIIDKVSKATEHLKLQPGQTRGELFMKLFGDRAGPVMAALTESLSTMKRLRGELNDIDDMAEKSGAKGLRGMAAAAKQWQSALDRLDLSIGQSGFNDRVETLMRTGQRFIDWVSGTTRRGSRGMGTTETVDHPAVLEALGWGALAVDALSKAALPIMALQALGGFTALGGLFRGAAWLTGLGQLKNIGSALSMFAVGGASGVLRFASGIGALIARSAGLAGLATNIGLVAGSARLLMGITGIGAALMIGAEIIQHWDQIANAITRTASALKELAKGNTAPLKQIGDDVGKSLGIDTPKDPRFQTQPHGRFGPGWQGFQTSPADRLGNAQRVTADVNLKTHVDPIQLIVPPTIRLEGTLTGANGVSAQVSGSIPLSATAPRGTTSATAPSNPVVPR